MEITTLPLLSILIWLPIIGGVVLLGIKEGEARTSLPIVATPAKTGARTLSLFISLTSLFICGLLFHGFDLTTWEMQWVELRPWITSLNIYYTLGIDGFSLPLIILTCFMTFLVVLASYRLTSIKITQYLAAFLIMQGLMCGVFAALDAILFYTFWEAMLIPMFLIIGIWGGNNRIYATLKFFLYTFLGSVLLLVALIYLHIKAKHSGIAPSAFVFNILVFQELPLTLEVQKWLFIAFLLAFAVKVPMWPVHTWLPDAHVEAPTGGSVILAAIMLKMGGYGFLRFILPITPDAGLYFANGIITLSLIAIVYIAFVAIVQKDMKKLIAYSSISHMGFVTLGFFLVFALFAKGGNVKAAAFGIQGAMVQMISHGFISGALFLCVGVLYDRMHSRLIKDYGGVVNTMPVFSAFFMLFAMANVGLPGTSGFVGEFLVVLSAFNAQFWIAGTAATILFLGASYTLWMVKRVIFGGPLNGTIAHLQDIGALEKTIFLLLAILVIGFGLWPQPLLELMEVSTGHLLEQATQSKL